MSVYGSTLLRRRVPTELTQLASLGNVISGTWKPSLLHPARRRWTQGCYVEHRNPEQRSGSCEFLLLSCYLSSSRGVGQGREETHSHCWGTLPSQAPCLDRPNVLATAPLPTASHPVHGKGAPRHDPCSGPAGGGRTPWQGHGHGQGQHCSCCWVLWWGLPQRPASLHTIPIGTWCSEEGCSWSHHLVRSF